MPQHPAALHALSAWPAVSGLLPLQPPPSILRVLHVALPPCAFRARFSGSLAGSCGKSAVHMAAYSNIGAHALSLLLAVLSRVPVCRSLALLTPLLSPFSASCSSRCSSSAACQVVFMLS